MVDLQITTSCDGLKLRFCPRATIHALLASHCFCFWTHLSNSSELLLNCAKERSFDPGGRQEVSRIVNVDFHCQVSSTTPKQQPSLSEHKRPEARIHF